MNSYIMTSEALTEGNLNKVCDLIANVIMYNYLAKDETSKVTVDVIINDKYLIVLGTIISKAYIDIRSIIKRELLKTSYGINIKDLEIILNIEYNKIDDENVALNIEQGLVFGYACNETNELMPLSIIYAQKLAKKLFNYVIENKTKFINNDGKVQVNVEYKNDRLSRIDSIYVYLNYLNEELNSGEINNIIENIIYTVINRKCVDNNTKILIKSINNKNELYIYGISGRKNYNDLYGGYSRYISCPLYGRTPNNIEIPAALMARFISKNIVATGLIDKVEIGLNYDLGILEPRSILVNSYGKQFDSGLINANDIIIMIKKVFPLNIYEIINFFKLLKCDYLENLKYGYFSNTDLPWEKINYAKRIKEYFIKEKGMIFLNY